MSYPSDWEKGRVWPPMETPMTETEKMRGALLQALSVIKLTTERYQLADDLLAQLEKSGWKLVKVDPFVTNSPAIGGADADVLTDRQGMLDAFTERLTRIEDWIDRHNEGWRHE